MNSYERIYTLLVEVGASEHSLGEAHSAGAHISSTMRSKRSTAGARGPQPQTGPSREDLKGAPGSAKAPKLPHERKPRLAKKTITEPLLKSGLANPVYTAIIKRFRGKLSPEVITAMKKRLRGSEENVSNQEFRQGRGK